MLNNNDFISLERRLWRESNPLCDELVSTRDELLYLLTEAKKLIEKYSPVMATLAAADDLDFYREWDNFADTVDNLTYDLGVDHETQYGLHEVGGLGPDPLNKFPSIRSKTL
jgi:Icc-related predicted phosphoesterase